jgi:uncharacterized membrane protein (UPF0127 family)
VDSNLKLVANDKIIAMNAKQAKGYFERLLGLMFKKELNKGSALVIPFCNWIHTFFMRFTIDVIYINSEYKVVDLIIGLKPWRYTMPRLKADHVIELPQSTLSSLDIKKGELIKCLD